jgi:hypothetical protein
MSATKVSLDTRQRSDGTVLIFSNTVRLLKMIDEFIVANCEFSTYTLNRRC